ncbi:MAG: GNAT family N-acetyltransferase [Bacteroidota bacterium]
MNLRPIHSTDAAAFIRLQEQIEADSPFALLERGERRTGIREQQQEIEDILRRDNQIIFVVEDRDQLVGWLGAWGEPYRRIRHSVLIGVGVLPAYRRQGVGTQLFEALEAWAWERGLRRMELLVQTGNSPGINLYRKMGFQIEGTKRQSYCIDGEYVDEYLMSKLLVVPEKPPHNPYPRW